MYKKLADRIGLPVETVRAGIWELERKANGLRRPLGLYRHRMESRLEASVYDLLQKQKKYILKHTAELSIFKEKGVRYVNTKALSGELNDMMGNLPHQKDMVQQLYSYGALVTLKAGDRSVKTYGLSKLGISWDLKNKAAIDWLSALKELHLSNRQGSVGNTTKTGIIDIIKQAAEQGQSYGEIAKQIEALDSTLFSRSRAELIATNTLGKAYEFGNRAPLQEAQHRGNVVEKFWQTVEDDKVTDECNANEAEGWIPMEQPHASGDQQPLRSGNPRCRCTELYRIIPKEGVDQDADVQEEVPLQNEEAPRAPGSPPPANLPPPEQIKTHLTLSDGSTVRSPTGYGYHAMTPDFVSRTGDKGLVPHVSKLDQDTDGKGPARVYFAIDEHLAGVGVTMDTEDMALTRVSLNQFLEKEAHKDPHIPNNISFFIDRGVPPAAIQIKDEYGKWVPILKYIKLHPSA